MLSCWFMLRTQSTESKTNHTKLLYQDLQRRKVEHIPDNLSRATILKVFHNHDLFIRALYHGSRITTTEDSTSPEGPTSTTFSTLNPKSDVTTVCTLTTLKDGICATIELGMGMKIDCRWTIQVREVESGKLLLGDGNATEPIEPVYLLEEVFFHIMKPFERWARNDHEKSHATEGILKLLEDLGMERMSTAVRPEVEEGDWVFP